MGRVRCVSWNVNGLRACLQKGFYDMLDKLNPDIVALQEIKTLEEQVDVTDLKQRGYETLFFSAKKKGYSGVALCLRRDSALDLASSSVERGMGLEKFDDEGRTIVLKTRHFTLVNCYFPNSQREGARLPYKLDFNRAIHAFCDSLVKQGTPVILTGDLNVAHTEIDLKNPKENQNNAGFLPEERAWMSSFLESGYIDTFRHFYPGVRDRYSWWSYRPGIRERNIGWRIDYFCVNRQAENLLINAEIHDQFYGSDHCPVSLDLSI